VGLLRNLLAQVEAERERNDFNNFYPERDGTRWYVRSTVEQDFGVGRSIALAHLYRRSDSVTDLYSYDHNALRVIAEWNLAPWAFHAEGEAALRNYRTPHGYDVNHARQDQRWRVGGSLGRNVIPHLAAELFGEYRRNDSTRPGKDYDVTSAGIALEVKR
jgi:hypothetical protein